MQKYSSNAVDLNGRPINGASILVTDSLGATATLYSDNGVTLKANPITTSQDGEYSFYAANGRYTIAVSASGFTGESLTDMRLHDPAEVYPSDIISVNLAAAGGSALVGGTWFGGVVATVAALATSVGASLLGFIQAGTGSVLRSIQAKLRETVSAIDFGADPAASAAVNDAAFAAAITYCAANFKALYVPGNGYNLSANLNLNGVRVFGDVNAQSSASFTFTSSVVSPTYAITLNNGQLERVTLKCSGTGNGIDAAMCVRRLGLHDVYVEAGSATTAGSIGVSFGTDATPGTQSITTTFKKVVSRNFDIGFWMRAYSNANVYEDFYALNTTVGSGTQGAAGFKVSAHGCTFMNPRAESNYVDGFRLETDSYSNTVVGLWLEGTNTNTLSVDGISNIVLNPFYGLNYTILNGNSRVIGRNGTAVPFEAFTGQGANVIPNSSFESALSGWTNAGTASINTVNTTWGFNSLDASSNGSGTLQSSVNITDPKVLQKLAGKSVTVLAVGQKLNASYAASVRLLVDSGAGYVQVGIGDEFSATAPSISRVTYMLPATVNGLQLRVFGQGANPATTLIARFGLPTMYVGADINDVAPARATDGSNTFFGNQTLSGGDWNTAHLLMGGNHVWANGGVFYTKSTAPASGTDGASFSPLRGSATFDPPSLAAGATQQTTVTVTGAAVGDVVTGVSFSIAHADILWLGQVTATNTVTVTQWNRGAGAVDLGSAILRVRVQKL